MASSAIRNVAVTAPGPSPLVPPRNRVRSGAGGLGYLAAVVVAAGRADMMRTLQLSAVGAFVIRTRRQGVMRPAHVAPRLRGFLFRNSHFRTLSTYKGGPGAALVSACAYWKRPRAASITDTWRLHGAAGLVGLPSAGFPTLQNGKRR